MIKECISVFEEEKRKYGMKLLLDSYIPSDGTYIIVKADGTFDEPVVIKLDKKTRRIDRTQDNISQICLYDYYSRYLNSNKAVDPKKIIQSNNYFSFFIKKESLTNGKLTEEIIDTYFDILADPYKKYKNAKAKALYSTVEENLGQVDQEALEWNRKWIKENIFQLEFEGKDYLKIFFERPKDDYEREGNRYFIPNLFNSNDYNIEVDGEILGLPDNNLGMNAKKPYLENKNRKVSTPYMITQKEAILQKEFFDLLMNFNMQGKNNVFVNTEEKRIQALANSIFPDSDFSGIFLRIQKGKTESEVHIQNVISQYTPKMKPFYFQNVLNFENFKPKELGEEYKRYRDKAGMQALLDDIFFSKYLINNYFSEDVGVKEGYIKNALISSRERIFNWLYKNQEEGMEEIIGDISMSLIIGTLKRDFFQKAIRQFNLRISLLQYLRGEEHMVDILQETQEILREKINDDIDRSIETEGEYFYAVGQLIQYFISLNRSTKRTYSLATPFIEAKNDKVIKEKLQQWFKKYSYDIETKNKRFRNLYAMINRIQDVGEVKKDELIAGLLSKSLIWEKKETEEEEKENE